MNIIVKAVAPYNEPNSCNFKMKPFLAWKGFTAPALYPPKYIIGFAHRVTIPCLFKKRKEARLHFMEAGTMNFCAFPNYAFYEIIPFIWDCWPRNDEKVVKWFRKNNVKTAIFTSSAAAERIKKCCPFVNMLVVTEGIDVDNYPKGKQLGERNNDLLSYGRTIRSLVRECKKNGNKVIMSPPQGRLEAALTDSKVTIAIPRCDVDKEFTGGQETLTQRYWECMLSRMVMIGRSPKELTNLIGYDPVIPIDCNNFPNQVKDILAHIEDYQELVDKNRETALRMAPWEIRMKQVMDWLESLGYQVR